MAKTYLELSEDSGAAHKFYEVVVDGNKMTIRYGRIGTDGRSTTKEFATEEAAQKEATKKIKAKQRKGYEEAIIGVRKKRAITRRSISSGRSSAKKAPVLWKFNSGSGAFGIYIDKDFCWIGNEAGSVFKLNHKGEVINQYQLPDGVKSIIADKEWIYVGCDDGNVYDLTGKLPRLAYAINESVDIYWLDINNGLLGVSDDAGGITVINYEDEEQWTKKSSGSAGWMVRCDDVGRVYHGHSNGMSCYYGWDGNNIWNKKTKGSVLFGWRTDDTILAGTSSGWLELFDKDGNELSKMKGDGAFFSCAAAPKNKFLFGGDSSSSVYCFDKEGSRLWKLATTCGSAYSMQYFDEKVFIVTTNGTLACIDASEAAIEKAQQGEVPKHIDIKAPKKIEVVASNVLEEAPDDTKGVLLVCVKEGAKLRVRVLSDGYNKDWNVQFPKNLRQAGSQYLVDKVSPSTNGEFYRVFGNIYTKNR